MEDNVSSDCFCGCSDCICEDLIKRDSIKVEAYRKMATKVTGQLSRTLVMIELFHYLSQFPILLQKSVGWRTIVGEEMEILKTEIVRERTSLACDDSLKMMINRSQMLGMHIVLENLFQRIAIHFK